MEYVNPIENLQEQLVKVKSSNELRNIVRDIRQFMNEIAEDKQLVYIQELYEVCKKIYVDPSERYSKWLSNDVAIHPYPESLTQVFAVNFLQLNRRSISVEVFEHYLDRIWDYSVLLRNKGTRTLSIEELEYILNDYIVDKFVRKINSIKPLSIFLIDEERSDKLGLCFSTDRTRIGIFAQSKRTGFTNVEAMLFMIGDIVFKYIYNERENEFEKAIIDIGIMTFGKDKENIIRNNARYIFAHSLLFRNKHKEEGIMGRKFLKSIGLIFPETLSGDIIDYSHEIINEFIN